MYACIHNTARDDEIISHCLLVYWEWLYRILKIIQGGKVLQFFTDWSVTAKLFQWNSLCNRLWSYKTTIQQWMFPANYSLVMQPKNFSASNDLHILYNTGGMSTLPDGVMVHIHTLRASVDSTYMGACVKTINVCILHFQHPKILSKLVIRCSASWYIYTVCLQICIVWNFCETCRFSLKVNLCDKILPNFMNC